MVARFLRRAMSEVRVLQMSGESVGGKARERGSERTELEVANKIRQGAEPGDLPTRSIGAGASGSYLPRALFCTWSLFRPMLWTAQLEVQLLFV